MNISKSHSAYQGSPCQKDLDLEIGDKVIGKAKPKPILLMVVRGHIYFF